MRRVFVDTVELNRAPYPRKAAFDLGSNGAGVNTNNLKLGMNKDRVSNRMTDKSRL
jgi:hypothetical protein